MVSLKSTASMILLLVEVLEYALVVLVSTLVAGFSLGVYGGYATEVERSSAEASYASVVSLAHAAVQQGKASATINLDRASIGCVSDSLEFASPAFSGNSPLPVHCAFPPQRLSGLRLVTFDYSSGELILQVR